MTLRVVIPVLLSCGLSLLNCQALVAQETSNKSVSYSRDVRPILQANCFGCHQGARKSGDYLMTSFDQLLAGGESGEVIVPGEPDESYLMELITPEDGEAAMPPDLDPLSEQQIELIRRWIQQGAKNDAPPRLTYSIDNPPYYSRLPVVTSLAFSTDGRILATNGNNEVLLLDAENDKVLSRLIGMSPRIESLRFSPNGKMLAVAGGMPGEFGELQIWDVEKNQQLLSKVVTHDTIYGVSWSPDGTKVAVGCADTSLRAFDVESGAQVLFQNAHEDWIRDTVFSTDGSHLVSVGRDMTCKLTEVAEERFVDNITSITPGVLKGGIASVARHPQRDELLIGGADGVPKVYRMFRQTKRVIGDDANLIRRMPPVDGRIQSVAISNDGQRMAVGSSLDGQGAVHVYSYEFDPTLPDDIKTIMSKVVSGRSSEEKKKLEEYVTRDVELISSRTFPQTGIYAVAFTPSGEQLAVAGLDGTIRLVETQSGQVVKEFDPLNLNVDLSTSTEIHSWRFADDEIRTTTNPVSEITSLNIEPDEIHFSDRAKYTQLIVTGKTIDGSTVDLTRQVEMHFDDQFLSVTKTGLVQPIKAGTTKLHVSIGDIAASIDVRCDSTAATRIDFVNDVAPVLSRLGCNAGTCHGSQTGKNGFQLSLRGYDPLFDVRALTDDLSSRRVNIASPDQSLMLLKPTAGVPHEGGQVVKPGSKYNWLIRQWIADGANYDQNSEKVVSIAIKPVNPVLDQIDSSQQVRVIASYPDGSRRDVTREAVVDSANLEVATVNSTGVVSSLRRGESAIIARYEGAFAATTLTVMGQRDGFEWTEPEKYNQVDNLVAVKWKRMKTLPSHLTDDYEFVRRVYLDLTGLPPSSDEVRKFVADDRSTQIKRDHLIDQLIGSEEFIEHWTNRWADLLQVNRKYLGPEGAASFRAWIRQQVSDNTPYDEFVTEILAADGSNKSNPAASYYKILREPAEIMENTTHLFMATRFNCNKCHDHPFERWTQDQYYQTAAYFAHVSLKKDPDSGDKKIGGTAVEGAKPLYEIVYDNQQGQVLHDRTGRVTEPTFPFQAIDSAIETDDSRRRQFAAWLTSAENPYFAKSYVNRLWGYLLGRGLIEPIDDIRASNPPTNPELLDWLTDEFVKNDFDPRHVIRLICKSRTYQLSVETNPYNSDDTINYSHAKARRLPAEVLFDAIHHSVGSQTKIPGFPVGTRAAELPDAGATVPSGFLETLGRPPRESVCECDRGDELQLGSVLALVSGPDQARAINDPGNKISELVADIKDNEKLIREVFMRILNRPPTDPEIELAKTSFDQINSDHDQLVIDKQKRLLDFEKRLPSLKKQRAEAVAAASNELTAYLQRTDPDLPAREKVRNQKISAAKTALESYNANIAQRFSQWRTEQLAGVQWQVIVPTEIRQSSGANSILRDDRSIHVLENKGATVTEVITETDQAGISAVRLEVIADPANPSQGPGLADNGNFVLTEFELEIASLENPDDWRPVKFDSVMSDFDQADYPIVRTVDGKFDGGNSQGWAVVPQTQQSHWGTYQLQLPIGFDKGSRLRFKLHQNYGFDKKHQIGRFRISISRTAEPVGLSVSEELLPKLVVPESQWGKTTRDSLMAIFKKGDGRLIALDQELKTAQRPLKIDPGIVSRRATHKRVSQAVPRDPVLVQLEQDVKYSEQQIANVRLTAAQDLVWALINSPSFLFNR